VGLPVSSAHWFFGDWGREVHTSADIGREFGGVELLICNAYILPELTAPMAFNPSTHHRRSIRLKGYDYSWTGWYYVTICTYQRVCLFGKIAGDQIQLHEIGKVVEEEWLKTPIIRAGIELDNYVIMPNHLHGILIIGDVRSDTPLQMHFVPHPNLWVR
jgi:hypothetical protein